MSLENTGEAGQEMAELSLEARHEQLAPLRVNTQTQLKHPGNVQEPSSIPPIPMRTSTRAGGR